MAKGPESLLYQKLRESLPNSMITRLESRVGLGIPDCLIALPPRWVMVELKVVKAGKKVNLSPHQIAFNLKHGMAGLPTFILVLHQKTTRAPDARLLLYHGRQCQELAEHGLEAEPLDSWPYNAVDWQELRERLIKTP